MSKKDFYYSISPAGAVCEYRHFTTKLQPPAELAGLFFPATFFDLLCNCEAGTACNAGIIEQYSHVIDENLQEFIESIV